MFCSSARLGGTDATAERVIASEVGRSRGWSKVRSMLAGPVGFGSTNRWYLAGWAWSSWRAVCGFDPVGVWRVGLEGCPGGWLIRVG